MERREFMSMVEKQASGCWHWLGSTRGNYGQCGEKDEPSRYAHRLAYRMFKGVIPPGHYVMHRCDNPICVRPAHLRVGTPLHNIQDALKKGRAGYTEEQRRAVSETQKRNWREGRYTHLVTSTRKRKRVTDGYL